MTTPVHFTGEVDGVSSLSTPAVYFTACGPTYGNWRININPNSTGRIIEHAISGTWTRFGPYTIAELAGLRDAINRKDWGTSACKYPPYWELLQATGTTIKHSADSGSTYQNVIIGQESELGQLKSLLDNLGLQ